jgi:hypothetical protein
MEWLLIELFQFLHSRVLDEGRRRFLNCRRLAENVSEDDIAWVVESVSESKTLS